MRLPHQVIESIKGAMQPLVRQHPIQTRNCEQDEEQQNEDGDNNLHERETALMPHSAILRRAGQTTIWHWNTSPWQDVLPWANSADNEPLKNGNGATARRSSIC